MARKRYDLAFHIDSSRAEAAGRRVVRILENAEAAAKRAGTAMEAAYNRAATAANNAATAMANAASRMPAGGGSGGGSGAGGGGRGGAGGGGASVEDRYFKADYDRRVRYEARKQQLAAAAAARAASLASSQATQVAAIEDRYAKADYDRRTKFEAKKQQQAAAEAAQLSSIEDRFSKRDLDRRTRYEAKKQQQAAAEAAKATSRAETQAAQLSSIEDRATKRDYDRRVAYERRQVAQKERTNRQLAALEDRYLRDEYRKRVAHAAQQQRAAEAQAEANASAREQMLARGVAVATAAAFAGIKILGDAYAKIREDAVTAAEATNSMRKSLRIEATLKGAEGPTNEMLGEALRLRNQTGLNEGDASELTRQYLGTIPIAFQKKNITESVSKDFMIQAGIRAARQGGDAGTHGELAGILGQFGKVESVSAGMGQLEAIRVALTEGRGDDPELTRQLLATAGSMVREGGNVGTLAEQAALIGVTSLSGGPQAAGTRALQLSRGIRSGLTKMRGGPGTKEPQAMWLKRIGVTEQDNLESSLDKIVPDIRKARAEGRELDVYLSEHGMKSSDERKALLETELVYEQLKSRFKAARESAAQGGDKALEANQRHLESPFGRSAVGDAMLDTAKATRGVRGERLAAYMKEAEASKEFQEGEASIGTQLTDRMSGYLMGNFTDPTKMGRDMRQLGVAGRIQLGRARAAGVTDEELTKARHTSYRAGSEEYTAEYFNLVDQLISQKGGSLQADIKPVMERLVTTLEQNNQLVAENNKRMGPPGPVAPPAPQALGKRP